MTVTEAGGARGAAGTRDPLIEDPVEPVEVEAPGGESETRKCVFVIFNPASGSGDPDERQSAISGALASHGYECQFLATTEEKGADALAKEALADGVDLIAVSGGDGTVMQALSALVGTDVPIAVLPGGTANLLSVNLGVPTQVPEAVEVALSGTPYALDLARTRDGRYFAIMGGMGLDGKVIEEADRAAKDRLGVLAYFVATLRNLKRRRASVRISLDGGPPLRRRAQTVLIANMGKVTGGLEAMPTASPDDGLLDVGIVRTRTVSHWLRLLGYMLLGRAQDDPGLEVHQARKVRIHARTPQPIQFDGEEGGRSQDLTVEVVPRAVRILLPEGAPAARDATEPPTVVARRSATRRLTIAAAALTAATVGTVLAVRYVRARRNRRRGSG